MMIKYLCSPRYFYSMLKVLKTPISLSSILAFILGLYWVFYLTPMDAVQGYTYRILYIHVPAAICSLAIYSAMALLSLIFLIWPLKIADMLCTKLAVLGLVFTLLVLITGSLWGRPMWGTWWIWDARLTSELLLACIYTAYIVLRQSLINHPKQAQICAVFACIGFLDLPVIHYSVIWWNTLHQGPSLLKLGWPSIHTSMLWPLIVMIIAFSLYCISVLILACLNHQMEQRHHNAIN
tara:strand:- start:902 stop:1612 length:711 start_codon:yes stop_codon:yes gene_type:complete